MFLIFFYILQRSVTFGIRRMSRLLQWIQGGLAWLMTGLCSFQALAPLFLSSSRTLAGTLEIAGVGTLIIGTGILVLYQRGAQTATAYDGTPDKAWHAGVFYYNPRDPALFVPKRLGYGWTLNFAHRRAWLWMLAALLPLTGGLVYKHLR